MVLGDSFIFVHVPRTGGVSVTEALGGRCAFVTLHRPLFQLRRDGYRQRAFGVVRNPWEWRVSLYCFGKRRVSFQEWLFGEEYLEDDLVKPGPPPLQRRSQKYWLDGCERVCRFETLERDLYSIVADWNLYASALPWHNSSIHGDFRDYYDAESAAYVAAHSAYEIKLGYRTPNHDRANRRQARHAAAEAGLRAAEA